ncbi:histidine kinase dimerization/phosphoacceptor domain -containing protein [Mucilaginibacter lutimaris]|uniref:histidine kinase n=1 Tax=Mucilaginibacter lutimaris TaxID=931629 RepID=A0ABW2ZL97_9SPHI
MFKQTYKVAFILFLLLAVTAQSFCQVTSSREIDSLRFVLQKTNDTKIRLKTLHELGALFLERQSRRLGPDLDTALTYFNTAYGLTANRNIEEHFGRLETLCRLGEVTIAKRDFEKGKGYFKNVLAYYKKSNQQQKLAQTWTRMGNALVNAGIGDLPDDYGTHVFNCFQQALNIYTHLGNKANEISAFSNLANAYYMMSDNESAEQVCSSAIKKYGAGNHFEMTPVYSLLAHVQRYRGNLNKALENILEAIRVFDNGPDLNKDFVHSSLYGELGEIYDALGQTSNCLIWYKKTLALRENMPIPLEYKYGVAGMIVRNLLKQKKYAEALNIALGIEKRHPASANYERASITLVKADCYDALKQYARAEELYVTGVAYYKGVGASEMVSIARYKAARFFIKQKKFDKAAIYLNVGVHSAAPVTQSMDYHLMMSEIDSAKGDYLASLRHYQLYKVLNDSIFNIEKSNQLQQLQVQFETAQKEKDIQLLRKDSKLAREKEVTATNTRNLILTVAILLIFAVGLIYNGYRRKQRSNVALNKLVQEKDDLILDKEWLLKEIHHRVKNNLQIAMGLLQRQSAYIDNDDALAAIHSSENRMRAIALIHQKLYQADNLNLIFMPEYIEEMISYLKDSCGLDNRIFFERHLDNIYLDVAQAVPLGLIMNEAITNAVKYAYASDAEGKIYITLLQESQYVHLTLADDGPGLPAHLDLEQVQSLGINLMRGLTKQLGGTFNISSNEGCMIEISFKAEVFKRDTAESKYL